MTDFEETDVVQGPDGRTGMIVTTIEEDTEWYPDPDDDDEFYEIEASEDEPVFLVAFDDGETMPLRPGQLEGGSWQDVEEPMNEDEIDDAAGGAELEGAYWATDDPHDFEEFMNALYEVGDLDEEQLEAELASPAMDLPGANTAGIGFATDPPGWDRSSYLKAWRTFRGKWRVCYPRMIRHFGPRMARRWCSALKDEVYQTTRWRVRGW